MNFYTPRLPRARGAIAALAGLTVFAGAAAALPIELRLAQALQ